MSRNKIIFIIILPIALVLVSALSVYSWSILRTGKQDAKDFLKRTVEERVNSVVLQSRGVVQHLEGIANVLSNPSGDLSKIIKQTVESNDLLRATVIAYDPDFLKKLRDNKFPDYKLDNCFGLLSSEGTPRLYCPMIFRTSDENMNYVNDDQTSYQFQEWYLVAKHGEKGNWSIPFVFEKSNTQVIAYSIPFYYKGTFAGVLSGFVQIDKIVSDQRQGRIILSTKMGGHFFVVSNDGHFVYHSFGNQWPYSNIYTAMADLDTGNQVDKLKAIFSGATDVFRLDNILVTKEGIERKNYWAVYSPLRNGTDFVLVATFDEAMIFAKIYKKLAGFWFAGISILLFLIAIVSWLLVKVFQPVVEMTHIAQKVAAGELNVQVDKKYESEKGDIGVLVHTFNGMITSLNDNIQKAVAESTQRDLLERELMIARDIQRSFMPIENSFFPEATSFVFDAKIIPAKYVAGDFFDCWQVNKDIIAIVIADVSGKGVPAAMIMIAARTLIRQVAEKKNSPGDILTEVNALMQKNNQNGMFVTLFFGMYHTNTGQFVYANAGHNPPLIMMEDGAVQWFKTPEDPIIGIFPDHVYTNYQLVLNHKERIFLYTDGVTDTTSNSGEQFGNDRLYNLMSRLRLQAPREFLPGVTTTLDSFCGPNQQDDITMMILQRS